MSRSYRSGSLIPYLMLLLSGLDGTRMKAQSASATGSIKGRIVDLQTGEPITKATVFVVGQTNLASTDLDGRFTLGIAPAAGNLGGELWRGGCAYAVRSAIWFADADQRGEQLA